MRRLHNKLMSVAPIALAAALLFALTPACDMPECNGTLGLADPIGHDCCPDMTDHGCQAYMMVDNAPESTPAMQHPPVFAVVAIDAIDHFESVSPSPYLPVAGARCVPDDPLGVRLRI